MTSRDEAMTDLRETVAVVLANYDARMVDVPEIACIEDFRFDADRDDYLARADAAIAAMQPAIAQARREALEEAAKAIRSAQYSPHPYTDCASAIRALIEKEAKCSE